jgi:hypothetical protein
MAIDGRNIAKQPKPDDAYESIGVRIVSQALIWVPLAFFVWFAYVSGTWLGGGWVMGVLSVASAVLTGFVVWLYMKVRRARR